MHAPHHYSTTTDPRFSAAAPLTPTRPPPSAPFQSRTESQGRACAGPGGQQAYVAGSGGQAEELASNISQHQQLPQPTFHDAGALSPAGYGVGVGGMFHERPFTTPFAAVGGGGGSQQPHQHLHDTDPAFSARAGVDNSGGGLLHPRHHHQLKGTYMGNPDGGGGHHQPPQYAPPPPPYLQPYGGQPAGGNPGGSYPQQAHHLGLTMMQRQAGPPPFGRQGGGSLGSGQYAVGRLQAPGGGGGMLLPHPRSRSSGSALPHSNSQPLPGHPYLQPFASAPAYGSYGAAPPAPEVCTCFSVPASARSWA